MDTRSWHGAQDSRVSERLLWERYLKPSMQRPPSRFARKVQDRFVQGLPDIVYNIEGSAGWLELKWIDRWPARAATGVDVGLTAPQAAWIRAWRDTGGTAHVLLGVGATREWLLYNDVGAVLEKQRRPMLEGRAETRGSLDDILPLITALRDRPA